MQKYYYGLLIFLLTGCNALGWGRATPTPVMDDIILERFLTQAPIPAHSTATPVPETKNSYLVPAGLPLPLADPLEVVGNIIASGSPSLVPLTRLLYDRFVIAGYRDTIRIEEVGADNVFQRYCAPPSDAQPAIDIVMTDRPMRQSELEHCLQERQKLVALRVAFEAVVVVINSDATFVNSISKAELATIFTARRWSDVRSGWPDAEIIRVIPPVNSTVATLFIDKILQHNSSTLQNASAITFLEDGKEIATTIADTPFSVGFLDYGDYQKNADELRLLPIDGVHPTHQTVSSGTYGLTYPLLLYTDLATLEAKPQVGEFLLYYLATINEVIDAAGNFPLDETLYERTKIVLLNALGQSAYLEQFAPTSTPAPPMQMTPTLTPTAAATIRSAVTSTLTSTLTSTVALTATVTVTK